VELSAIDKARYDDIVDLPSSITDDVTIKDLSFSLFELFIFEYSRLNSVASIDSLS